MRAGTLIVDIQANVARLQQDMAQAKGIVQDSMRDITRAVDVAKTALGALGLGVGVGAIAQMTLNINKATAALDDMAEVTGTAVEELSRLQVVAKVGGHDFSLVEDSLVKLTKGLKGTETETINARNALEQLGIKAKTAAGQQRDAGEIMREVAQKFATFHDGAAKTAYALDLFGKSGAKLLPFLKDMAEEGAVAARVTGEQARQAEVLEKNLNRLKIAAEDSKREFVFGLTPALVEFTEALLAAQRAAGNPIRALFTMGSAAGVNPGERIAQIDRELPDVEKSARAAGQVANFFGGKYSAAGIGAMAGGVQAGQMVAERQYLLNLLGSNARGLEDDLSGTFRGPAALPRGVRTPPPGSEGAKGKSLADLLNESAGVNKGYYEDLEKLHAGYSAGKITLDQYRESVIKLTEKQAFAKDLAKIHAEEVKRMTDESRAAFEAEQKRGAQMVEFIAVNDQEIRQLEFENKLIGLSTEQREKAVALRKIELDLKRQSKGLSDEEAEALQREADAAAARLVTLYDEKIAREGVRKAAEEAQRQMTDAIKSRSENLTRVISDTIRTGFEHGGKSGVEALKDAIRNASWTAVFEPMIHALVSPLARAVAGVMGSIGIGGNAPAGGGLPGGGGGLNLLSNANSAYNLFSGGTGNALMGIGNTLGIGVGYNAAAIGGTMGVAELGMVAGGASSLGAGGAMAGAVGAEMGGAAAAGMLAAEGGAGLMAAGSMAGPIGLAIAAIAMMAMSSGEDKRKPSDISLQRLSDGGLHFSQNNVTDSSWGEAYDMQFIQAFRALGPKGQAFLNQYAGQGWTASGPDSAQNMVSQHIAPLLAQAQQIDQGEKAAEKAAEANRTGMRESLLAAKDPLGYWGGQVSALQGTTGSAASTIEDWRAEFLAALEGPLVQEQFDNWLKLGQAIENVGKIAGETATAAERAQADLAATWQGRMQGIGSVEAVLKDYVGGMSVSEYLSPESRLSGARSLYDAVLGKASSGDTSAGAELPGLAQTLLGAGRSVYASGGQFQDLFTQVNNDLARVLEQQGQAQASLFAEMPAAIREASSDTIAQLKALREEIRAGLERLNMGLRQMTAGLA